MNLSSLHRRILALGYDPDDINSFYIQGIYDLIDVMFLFNLSHNYKGKSNKFTDIKSLIKQEFKYNKTIISAKLYY